MATEAEARIYGLLVMLMLRTGQGEIKFTHDERKAAAGYRLVSVIDEEDRFCLRVEEDV